MKRALLLLVLAGCATNPEVKSVSAVTEYGTEVTLFDSPCKNEAVLSRIKEQHQASFRAGRAQFQGKAVALCWRAFPEHETVFVIDETGGAGGVPLAAFGGSVL